MRVSSTLRSIALRQPAATKAALWAIARSYMIAPRPRHWFFDQLAADLDYRVPVTTRLGNGMTIRVPWNDDGGRAIYETGWYELPTVRVAESILKPGMILFDVGANIGQYTLLASKILGPTGSVHSFEPSPTTYAWLARNVNLNDAQNVHLNRLGLSDNDKTVTLYLSTPENQGATSMRQQYNFSGRTAAVCCVIMDGYMAQHNIPRVDAMKVDVEGAELEVLRGAERALTGSHRLSVILEFEEGCQKRFDSSCHTLAHFLTSRGYTLMTIRPTGLEPYEDRHAEAYTLNVLAIPQEGAMRTRPAGG